MAKRDEASMSGAATSIPVAKIRANEHQPRKTIHKKTLAELESSIRRVGLLSPVSVIPQKDGTFTLIGGQRRLQAVKRLGWRDVPAHLLDAAMLEKERGGTSLAELALIDNIQREDLNPIEEGEAYSELIDHYEWTEKQLGDRLGKAQSFISDKIRLTALDDRVKKLVAEGRLSFSQAREIIRVKDPDEQAKAARMVVAENLTVVETKALVDKLLGKERGRDAAKNPRPFTPKRAINVLETLDAGLRGLRPQKIDQRWRGDLLKNIEVVLTRLERLRDGLSEAD